MNIDVLKSYINNKKIKWSTHCVQRMDERDITRQDVLNCIIYGEILEEYPEDYPNPSCLVFGYDLKKKVIHVVAGYDEEFIYIITVYRPNLDKFEANMKTRRRA